MTIDGGGIRGIFPAAVLARIEARFLSGQSIADYFDLIAGTSTGGIVALGLAAGLTGKQLRDLYIDRGQEVFPPAKSDWLGRTVHRLKACQRLVFYAYDQDALENILRENFDDRLLGSATKRLCIPSFDGVHGEVYIFKTPHHPDFQLDWKEPMVKVALATAAAPTFFRPLQHGGYTLVDGGVWANNPIMIAVTETLASFDVRRDQVQVLSLGCGDDPYWVGGRKISLGGMLSWTDIIFGAMRLQSQNALGQAGLLIGPENILRIDAPPFTPKIALDDWSRARALLPAAANLAFEEAADQIVHRFITYPADPYHPITIA